jgi:hypothetical protein
VRAAVAARAERVSARVDEPIVALTAAQNPRSVTDVLKSQQKNWRGRPCVIRRMCNVHKASLALATVISAMAGASAIDGASAQSSRWESASQDLRIVLRAPQPNSIQPGATSRPSSFNVRAAPSMGGRGMRGMGGGRMNGSMRRAKHERRM